MWATGYLPGLQLDKTAVQVNFGASASLLETTSTNFVIRCFDYLSYSFDEYKLHAYTKVQHMLVQQRRLPCLVLSQVNQMTD